MATSRRMPTNIDVLDDLTEKVSQNGNTTEIGGNAEIDGNLQVNGTIKQGKNPVLTSGNVKTLFGNKSIYGSGNIDLYQHVIKGQALNGGSWGGGAVEFMITVISSKNLKVDSLTDLKTLLGNTFEYPATGYYEGNVTSIWMISQSHASDNDGTNFGLEAFTFTDTVTTV